MRRTTLAAVLAVTLALAVPAGAQALTVYAATSLTTTRQLLPTRSGCTC